MIFNVDGRAYVAVPVLPIDPEVALDIDDGDIEDPQVAIDDAKFCRVFLVVAKALSMLGYCLFKSKIF